MMRTLSAMVILLLLLLSAVSVPATAAYGSGGSDGAGAGAQGNGGDSAGDGAAPSEPEGPQAQPLQEEQERKQQTTVEQPGVQINQQDRDQTQGRTNVSTSDDIVLQRDRDHFLQQVGMRQQNLSGERDGAQVALYALSIAGNVTGRDGPELARLGAELNTSSAAAYAAEEQIKNRNSLMRMLYGGDREAAGLLIQYADQNQQRIQVMEGLLANCSDCDPQVRLMLEEQVQVLSQEQNRLIVLGQEEQADKGLFGWLF
ncbi:hypothetical protein [Methanofollis tationis]|uniref:Uncharacterized protein n=1 Tax=Methanofollis tationis TaxID=81417 RepID=A0A7K4HLS9_9EURY|nr:hypothetical protein [Methanofollis tationis]NVO65880.1 hypothetical protein [Methanofollis tationis]